MGARWMGFLFCALAMVGVGSTMVASKLIAHGLPPFAATALRFAIAFPLFVVAMRLRGERWPRLGLRDALLVIVQAASGSVGYTVLLLAGMRHTSATDAGVIAGCLPAVAALISVVALRERPGMFTLAAVGLATAGVLACTVGAPAADGGTAATIAGDLLVLAAVLCEGVFILLNKRLNVSMSALQTSTLMAGIGLALSLVPALFERPWALAFDAPALGCVVYYALVPTVGGFLLWFAGSARIEGAQASALTALVPVSAAVLAALWLHETMMPVQWAGLACVLGAVALIAVDGASRLRGQRESPRLGMRRAD